MSDTDLIEVFSSMLDEPPAAQFDVERAIRGGRRIRARRWTVAVSGLVAASALVVLLPSAFQGITGSIQGAPAASSSPRAAGFPYGSDAQVHPLPNSNYTPPPSIVAVRLADPAPGFPYRVQPDGLYALTVGASSPCYGAQFVVSQTPVGANGASATVLVTDCPGIDPASTSIEGHPVVRRTTVAGSPASITQYPTAGGATGTTNSVLYFVTNKFAVRVEGTSLSDRELIALAQGLRSIS